MKTSAERPFSPMNGCLHGYRQKVGHSSVKMAGLSGKSVNVTISQTIIQFFR
ncbi:hypothetical protein [Spirosoma gilvum]